MKAEALALSTIDKSHVPPCLSVWDEALTTLQQVLNFTGKATGRGFHAHVAKLRQVPPVDVLYDTNVPPGVAGQPGSSGHAGITGLDIGGDSERRVRRKKLLELFSHMP